jgi:hypothetical protein
VAFLLLVYSFFVCRSEYILLGGFMSSREESKEIAFLLKNGDWAFPVKVESEKTGNLSFRSAPKDVNKFGFDWNNNEVEVSEVEMIDDVLNKGRRTRCTSTST